MAYKKIEKPEVNTEVEETTGETVATAAAEADKPSPSVIFKTKEKIPLDATVMVKNATAGRLVYVSKHLIGYTIFWESFGEEVPIEMSELYYMKNTDPKFFTENWIEVDLAVLRDLQMDRYYTNAITIDEINQMFELDTDILIGKVKNAKKSIQNTIGIKAMEMIKDGRLTNINTISALEKALDCELYEH